MANIDNWTCEQSLPSLLKSTIKDFWNKGQFSHFIGVDEVSIKYAFFHHNQSAETLIIVSGRSEGYLKYKELAFDFFNQGFNVCLIDHRGQGLSQRLLKDPHKGYVANFDDYAQDLAKFITEIVNPLSSNKPLILAHSMGAAISIRLMQLYPDLIKASVLSSPMIAINSGAIPSLIAKLVIKAGARLNTLLSPVPWYFLGQGKYQVKSFLDNPLTFSSCRYQLFIDLYNKQPKLQLGGVTFHWLAQALYANKTIFSDINKLDTPIMMLQASEDSIVDNTEQDKFCKAAKHVVADAAPVIIQNAKHEIFFEKDTARNYALSTTLVWLKQFTTS